MQYERRISGKSGSLPGTPVYIGDTPPNETTISVLAYSENEIQEHENIRPEEIRTFLKPGLHVWIRIQGLNNIEVINASLSSFSIHPLIIEDILNTEGRSKIEEFDDYLFIVLNRFYSTCDVIKEEQISIILNEDMVITCSETKDSFIDIKGRIDHIRGRFRENNVDYLAYSIIDTIVDDYFSVLENLEERIEDLEDEIINNPQSDTIRSIQSFRHDVIWFRRRIWSLREIVRRLERTDSPYIHTKLHIYLRDVYDHTIKISEDIDVYRDMTEGLMEIYLSNISNYSNQIMKVLTIIATIFIPLTFISSIYGMNFVNMPELSYPYGYPLVLMFLATIGFIMVLYFRKKKWI